MSGAAAAAPGAPRNLRISIPKWGGKWAVGMDEFKEGEVGAKSRNLANLRGKLPDWVKLPPAVTVPFGSFEKVRCLGLCCLGTCCSPSGHVDRCSRCVIKLTVSYPSTPPP